VGTPRISVVIPTRNRADSLRSCLTAVLEEIDPVRDEVIVADDGSGDAIVSVVNDFPAVTWLRLSHAGTCAARNRAVGAATGDVVLFLDDDIVCSEGLVDKHRRFHSDHIDVVDCLVGLVTWDQTRPISKHMVWLEDGGPLFSFNTIADPEDVDPRHFCTANVSVKRDFLVQVEGPFDERIKRFTDVELGLRLADLGMRLHFASDAVGWHLRSDTPASTDQRMFEVGKASVLLDEIHPGIAPSAADLSMARGLRVLAARMLTPIAPVLPSSIANRIWASRAAWSYARGRSAARGSGA